MRIAICDSDVQARAHYAQTMRTMCEKRGMSASIIEFEKGSQLESALDESDNPPDIIFLNALIPGHEGLEVGHRIRGNGYAGAIIYLSRTDDYMMPAFSAGAFDRAIEAKGGTVDSRIRRVLLRAGDHARLGTGNERKFIVLNGISEYHNLPLNSILYFESRKHIMVVHYGDDESFEFVSSLSKIESAVAGNGFLRIHRSYLVNSAAIVRFNAKRIVLADGSDLPVGRTRYADLKEEILNNAAVNLADEVG